MLGKRNGGGICKVLVLISGVDSQEEMCNNDTMKRKRESQLPQFLKPYFWDVDFTKLQVKTHTFFIIKRVLDRGNLSEIRWLLKTYGKSEIKKVVMSTKDLSRPTGNFWADILEIDKKEVPCLQKLYFPIHFGLSS